MTMSFRRHEFALCAALPWRARPGLALKVPRQTCNNAQLMKGRMSFSDCICLATSQHVQVSGTIQGLMEGLRSWRTTSRYLK
jgi:hypothetical protein